jgi:protein involved in polysaccharide export with SLBB domain
MKRYMKWIGTVGLGLVLGLTSPAAAQVTDPGRVQMTRSELEAVLAELETASRNDSYSSAARARARSEATMVRQRLEEGDFQTGDRVVLSVRNEESLNDTFTVSGGRMLPLPLGGNVPLAGVLRSELEDHLREHLAKYIREPDVQAESLMRVTISGQVNTPGFYVVRAQSLIGDVIMTAGGPTQQAEVTSLYVEREGRKIWEGPGLDQAIAEGRTLDQLSIRAGDVFILPERQERQGIGRMLLYVVPPVVSLLLALSQLR